MDRRRGASVATFFVAGPLALDAAVELDAGAVRHAQVRRLSPGARVRLTNGSGTIALGTLETLKRDRALVQVGSAEAVPPPRRLELLVPVADRDRMLWLAEKVTELGVTSWTGVRYRRSLSVGPRGEGDAFHRKLRARMVAALEQSAGAWLPELRPDATLGDAVAMPADARLVLRQDGAPLAGVTLAGSCALAVGPEGGLEADEQDAFHAADWRPASLGRTTLRFETAAIAGVAVLRARETVATED